MDDTLLDALHRYHARKWEVMPLRVSVIGKSPIPLRGEEGKDWQHRGLSAWPDIHATWDTATPLQVGILTGEPSGIWVLDVDPRHGGFEQVEALQREYGPLPATYIVSTGNGGIHFYWAMPTDTDVRNATRLAGHAGLDVRGTGGYVTAPPSTNGRGVYTVWLDMQPVPAPGWLLELTRKPEQKINGAPIAALPMLDLSPAECRRVSEYAHAAVKRELERLDTAPEGTRNDTAHQVACNLLELIQSPWAQLSEEAIYTAYLRAGRGRPGEVAACWASAVNTVAGKTRPYPALPDVTWEPPPFPVQDPITRVEGLTLPEEFWSSRPALGQIRQAAHSRGGSGDVAFYAVLARLAALWPHGVRLDSGVRALASANIFAAIVGPSGSGKSSGVSIAEDLLPAPAWLPPRLFGDGLPLGSGEGLAESFMGWEEKPVADINGVKVLDKTGNQKTQRVRCQVRHNGLFYLDEGEGLAKLLERAGATVGEALRRAWTGGTLGQQNGRDETTRRIPGGSYSLGLVIGFQRETCQALLADAAAGTPQRFLWAWAIDRAQPSNRVDFPGALGGIWRAGDDQEWLIGGLGTPAGTGDEQASVTYAESIRARLWEENVARTRGDLVTSALDEHKPLTLVKVSALLAKLDGRSHVTEEDWALAEMVWATSCNVRDHLIAYGRDLAGKAAAATRAAYAEREGAAEGSRLAVRAQAESAAVERVARRLAARVHENGVTQRRDVMSRTAARDRPHFVEALAFAVAAGWVVESGTDVAPGGSKPADLG